MHDSLYALILGIVEGLTEFLPVSSTAHIRLAQALLGIPAADNFWKLFAVAIQLPAVLAVIFYFFPQIVRFIKSFVAPGLTLGQRLRHPVVLVMIGTVVTAVPALIAKKLSFIDKNLESHYVMGTALLVGGVVMWIVDSYFGKRERLLLTDAQATAAVGMPQNDAAMTSVDHSAQTMPALTPSPANSTAVSPAAMSNPAIITTLEQMKPWQAIWIGAVQTLAAIFPGTSRSMATIAAGQVVNLTRAAALEFSFFMSIPLMFAACLKDMRDATKPGDPAYLGHPMTSHEAVTLGIGSVVSFLVAFAVIAWFMAWVRRRGFVPFAVYRIILGVVVLISASRGLLG